jgi:putative tricarboxylic transport membrane protein
MKSRDAISSLICIITGILFCIGAVRYGFGSPRSIGPGFLPFIAGMGLIVMSSILLISANKNGSYLKNQVEKFIPEKSIVKKMLISIFALFAYGIVLESLGFIVTSVLFIILILKIVESQRLGMVFLATFLTTLLSYVIFVVLLQSQLPKGVLGL